MTADTAMIEMALSVGVLAAAYNLYVTLRMLTCPDDGPGQKAAQLGVIWLLPVAGALLVDWFLRNGTAVTPWHPTDFIPQQRQSTGGG